MIRRSFLSLLASLIASFRWLAPWPSDSTLTYDARITPDMLIDLLTATWREIDSESRCWFDCKIVSQSRVLVFVTMKPTPYHHRAYMTHETFETFEPKDFNGPEWVTDLQHLASRVGVGPWKHRFDPSGVKEVTSFRSKMPWAKHR